MVAVEVAPAPRRETRMREYGISYDIDSISYHKDNIIFHVPRLLHRSRPYHNDLTYALVIVCE